MVSHYIKNSSNAKERLKDISQHFFSDSATANYMASYSVWQATRHAKRKGGGTAPITFLPVLLEPRYQDFCVFGINNYFNAELKLCRVVNVDSTVRESLSIDLPVELFIEEQPEFELTNETNINRLKIVNHLNGLELKQEICLLPFASPKLSLVNDGDFLLIIVPASLAGVRSIFHRLELICENMTDLLIGVVVVGANSMQMSQLCYDVIENSITSFLDHTSIALGHLLSESAVDLNKDRAIQFSGETNTLNSAPIELEDIADRVWDTFFKLLTRNRSMNMSTPLKTLKKGGISHNDDHSTYLSASA